MIIRIISINLMINLFVILILIQFRTFIMISCIRRDSLKIY